MNGLRAFLFCLALCPSLLGFAQVAPLHHWVGFADKAGSSVNLSDPNAGLQLLSQRALDRRQRHGVALDSLDLPVSPSAIAAVLTVGNLPEGPAFRKLYESRWLNGCLLYTSPSPRDS